jgi:IMP dehydrogenase
MPPTLISEFALSFDDVLLLPQYNNDIKSRLDTDLSTRLTKNISLKHVICSTNMSTVTEFEMAKTLWESGSCGFLHRFMSTEKMIDIIDQCKVINMYPICASIGVKEEDKKLLSDLLDRKNRPDIILIDIAHGDCSMLISMIHHVKERYKNVDVIAGNVATGNGAVRLAQAGADAIRCGIGCGCCCTTQNVTAHGAPLLFSIEKCRESLDNHGFDIPIIADGGIRSSGDIIKCLAWGSETVSLGGILASTSDSPTELVNGDDGPKKKMYGMASKEAQEIRGGLKPGTAPEGIIKMLPYKGETRLVLEELLGGAKSGLSYAGAKNLKELRENAEYIIVSPNFTIASKFK